jgi:homoserine O-acetyltransferase
MRFKALIVLAVALTFSMEVDAAAHAQPAPQQGDWTIHDFRFHTGEVMADMKVHYATLGSPSNPAVLVLHGTGGNGAGMLGGSFGGALFGPGQPLDAATHYIIAPDTIGAGRSAKPSDGLRMTFPAYDYGDMVHAQYRLLSEHLGVRHLALVTGNSMGGMLTWLWGETYPDYMDALVPLASSPIQVAGRNWFYRRMTIDLIKADPAWAGGNYKTEPKGLTLAQTYFGLISSGGVRGRYAASPTWQAADDTVSAALAKPSGGDANDEIYQLMAARDYDPEPHLEAIKARLLAINSEDDERNPVELGVLPRDIPRVAHGRYYIIPASAQTHGHGTTGNAKLWAYLLPDFLARK